VYGLTNTIVIVVRELARALWVVPRELLLILALLPKELWRVGVMVRNGLRRAIGSR